MAGSSSSSEGKVPFQYVRGVTPFPPSPRFTKENILSAMDYKPRDDDIVLVSYPKTGSTWMQYIVLQIINGPDCFPKLHDMVVDFIPYIELTGASSVENLAPPRIWKTHFAYDNVPKNDKAKYIYTFRDPRDVLVSYYYFLRVLGYDVLPFDDVFECFVSGRVPYGDYFDHVQSWFAHKNNPQILLVSYEHQRADPRQHILKIAEFLGEQYYYRLKTTEGLIEKIVVNTSFDHMKENLHFNPKADVTGKETLPGQSIQDEKSGFFRKGTVGDWKNHLSGEQVRRLEERARERLLDEQLLKMWNI